MATVSLKIDTRNPRVKRAIDHVPSSDISGKASGLEEAIEDVKSGKVHFAKNAKDLIRQCSK